MSPWLTIWFRPRSTLRDLTRRKRSPVVLLLAALLGAQIILTRQAGSELPDTMSFLGVLLITALGAPFAGLLYLLIGAALVGGSGVWLGGRAESREIRAVLAWSAVPWLSVLPLWALALAMYGAEVFSSSGPFGDTGPMPGFVVLFYVLQTILWVWSVVVLVNGLAEVQKFSRWAAVGNLLLALLGWAVAIVLIVGVNRLFF